MTLSFKMLLAGCVMIGVVSGCAKDEANPTDPNNGGGNNSGNFKKEISTLPGSLAREK